MIVSQIDAMGWLPAGGEGQTLALKQISSSSLVQPQLKAELSFACALPETSVQGGHVKQSAEIATCAGVNTLQYCVSGKDII